MAEGGTLLHEGPKRLIHGTTSYLISFLLGLLGFLSTVLFVTPFLPWWMEPSEMNKTNLASAKLFLFGVW